MLERSVRSATACAGGRRKRPAVRFTPLLYAVGWVLATIAFAESEKPVDVRTLAGDWRAVNGPAAIHINEDGTYAGTAVNGARTIGKITVTAGEASYRSTTSLGTVSSSEEDGKDVLTFRPIGGDSAKLQRVKAP